MTYTITVQDDGTSILHVTFDDEGVDLAGEVSIRGDAAVAAAYAPVFVRDLRTNYADLFSQPEMPIGGEIE